VRVRKTVSDVKEILSLHIASEEMGIWVGKRQRTVSPIQVAFLQCLSFPGFEIAERIKPARLVTVLFHYSFLQGAISLPVEFDEE